MDEEPSALLAWSLAGFHVALLVALLVAGLYLGGAAGDLLAGLDTVVGLALYGYLWAVTWWTNRRWIATTGLVTTGRPTPGAVLGSAIQWGGATGLLFLVVPLAVVVGFLVVTGGLGALPFALLVVVIGGLLAAAIGAVVGGLLAGLDLVLLRASRLVVPAAAPDRDGAPTPAE